MTNNKEVPEENSADPHAAAGHEQLLTDHQITPSIADMEVHHHPDIHHKKKKFKEYFLEFLMIFLAVTLGFFAESLRENIGDNNKEHEYMQSLVNDLKTDSLIMGHVVRDNLRKSAGLQSLMASLKDLSNPNNRVTAYNFAHYAAFYSIFKSNDATMLQLKNSGGLRVIKKGHVADSISLYDHEVKIIYASEDLYNNASTAAIAATHQVIDFSIYYDTAYCKNDNLTGKPMDLLTDDPKKIKFFFNEINFEKGAVDNYINNIRQRQPFLKRLIQYLQKEYQLEQK